MSFRDSLRIAGFCWAPAGGGFRKMLVFMAKIRLSSVDYCAGIEYDLRSNCFLYVQEFFRTCAKIGNVDE
jgi:hypothetical protein